MIESGSVQKLTVAAVNDRLLSELKTIGFAVASSRVLKMVKKTNIETEVFLYPGVSRDGARIRIAPVIGVENVHLRERLLAADARRWKGGTRVCHAYLWLLSSSWMSIHVTNGQELDDAIAVVLRSVVEVGLSRMQEVDTLDKVKGLLRNPRAPTLKKPRVVVLFPREKLAVLQDH